MKGYCRFAVRSPHPNKWLLGFTAQPLTPLLFNVVQGPSARLSA
jgi:hypothetical protein